MSKERRLSQCEDICEQENEDPNQIHYEMCVRIGHEPTEEEIAEAMRKNPYKGSIVLLDVPHKEGADTWA